MTDNELVYLCAFRYALGRHSYIVSVICKELRKAIEEKKLSPRAMEQIADEIKVTIRRYGIIYDCDKEEWLSLRDYVQQKLIGMKNN